MTRSRSSAKAAGSRFERSIADCLAGLVDDRIDRRVFADRLLPFVEFDAAQCWLWNGYRYGNGYAAMSWLGRQQLLHRLSYAMFVGPIPDGLVLDHLCRVKHCINPSHLEPVTSGENTRRAMRTHCVNGHAFTPENTYTPADGKRYCRTCRRRRVVEYRARRRSHVA